MSIRQYKQKFGVIRTVIIKIWSFIKHCYMSIVEILSLVLTFIAGGGLVKFATLRSEKKKSLAQADGEEINNFTEMTKNWQNLTNELQEQLKEARQEKRDVEVKLEAKIVTLEGKLDDRWSDTISLRDQVQEKMLEITDLKVKLAQQEPKICEVRGCKSREPQSGF